MTVFTVMGHVRHTVYIPNILLRIFGETSNCVSTQFEHESFRAQSVLALQVYI